MWVKIDTHYSFISYELVLSKYRRNKLNKCHTSSFVSDGFCRLYTKYKCPESFVFQNSCCVLGSSLRSYINTSCLLLHLSSLAQPPLLDVFYGFGLSGKQNILANRHLVLASSQGLCSETAAPSRRFSPSVCTRCLFAPPNTEIFVVTLTVTDSPITFCETKRLFLSQVRNWSNREEMTELIWVYRRAGTTTERLRITPEHFNWKPMFPPGI